MMPLAMMQEGTENRIQRIGGKTEKRKHLENLGFVVGGDVTVVTKTCGTVIVNVKNSRVAIGRELANRILVSPCRN